MLTHNATAGDPVPTFSADILMVKALLTVDERIDRFELSPDV